MEEKPGHQAKGIAFITDEPRAEDQENKKLFDTLNNGNIYPASGDAYQCNRMITPKAYH